MDPEQTWFRRCFFIYNPGKGLGAFGCQLLVGIYSGLSNALQIDAGTPPHGIPINAIDPDR